ncbi:MAG: hypothetical protein DSY33_03995 [Archaeoglobus sp.]|jgi:uncharacterized DUF497 family protein|nr:MAG: hypothetical protein DSY33_03995 [Archaeoglobus sp.]
MHYWEEIELIYDDETLNHIVKHNVTIEEVIHVLKHSKKIATKLKEDCYAIIGEYYGRCLALILTREKGNRFILRTARDCNEREKRRYRGKYRK